MSNPNNPFNATAFRIGRNKAYALPDDENDFGVVLLIDCPVYGQVAALKIKMSIADYFDWQNRRRLIQEIFPAMDGAVRETLVSGTTPAEWQKMFDVPKRRRYKVPELQALGYVFEPEYLEHVAAKEQSQ